MKNILYNIMIKNNIPIEKDVFDYGWFVFVQYFLYFVLIVPFIIVYNLHVTFLFFIIFFIPLRRYFGGFHFKRKTLCTFFSITFTLIILYISKSIKIDSILSILFLFMFIIILNMIGPIDHPNKRLSNQDIQQYKKKGQITTHIYFLLYIFLLLAKKIDISRILFITTFFCTINVTYAKVSKRIKDKEREN